jgi:hypothetical protein
LANRRQQLLAAGRLPHGGAASEAASSLVVVDSPVLIVEPPGKTATGWLRLRNNSATPLSLTLSARGFVSSTTSNELMAGVIIYEGDKGLSSRELNGIASGSNVAVRVEVANLWEAGESQAIVVGQRPNPPP